MRPQYPVRAKGPDGLVHLMAREPRKGSAGLTECELWFSWPDIVNNFPKAVPTTLPPNCIECFYESDR